MGSDNVLLLQKPTRASKGPQKTLANSELRKLRELVLTDVRARSYVDLFETAKRYGLELPTFEMLATVNILARTGLVIPDGVDTYTPRELFVFLRGGRNPTSLKDVETPDRDRLGRRLVLPANYLDSRFETYLGVLVGERPVCFIFTPERLEPSKDRAGEIVYIHPSKESVIILGTPNTSGLRHSFVVDISITTSHSSASGQDFSFGFPTDTDFISPLRFHFKSSESVSAGITREAVSYLVSVLTERSIDADKKPSSQCFGKDQIFVENLSQSHMDPSIHLSHVIEYIASRVQMPDLAPFLAALPKWE